MKKVFLIMFTIISVVSAQSVTRKFDVIQKVSVRAKGVGDIALVEYSVKSVDGEELYKIEGKTDYDVPFGELKVFEDGSSVLINAFYGTLSFYSNTGVKTKTLKIKENIEVEYERAIKSIIDKDILLVSFSEQNENFTTMKIYNSTGALKNEIKIYFKNIIGIAYSKSLNQIYFSHVVWSNGGLFTKRISVLNTNGEIINSFDSEFEKGFFTGNEIFYGLSNKLVVSIDCKNLKINFQKRIEGDYFVIDFSFTVNTLILATSKAPVLKNGEWLYKNITLTKLDSIGTVVEATDYKTKVFSKHKFKVFNNSLQFITDNESIEVKK